MKTQEQTEATKAFASVKNHLLDQYWIDQMNKQAEAAIAAERSRIVAELEAAIDYEPGGDFRNDLNRGLRAAIEIVKGGKK